MALPNTFRSLYIKIGDGASPETFAQDCTINAERGIQFQSQGQDVFVPDCNNQEGLTWRQHFKGGLSATINGAGTADADSIPGMDDWFRNDVTKNIKVFAADQGSWLGAFKLTDLQWSGNPTTGQPVNFTCTLTSHGEVQPYVAA